ncbi:LURP-one-related family protein [Proteiniclasticum sp.]|uniref:LURP-one-related/scramblase family protein n=1 Tax=Proteiniclasticum sp. TaxID=2053595 RepID=UPI00289A95D1|nr:LURP-one-related family protein [Proteiniclasticum sp.]
MKLYMKQKVFSWKDRFYIKDENEQDRYYVEGELFSWGKKLHVYDLAGKEVAFIQQKVFSWLPKFYVYIEDELIAEIVKEFTFFKPKYSIQGLNWEVSGDFWAHDYEIYDGRDPVVSIQKEWFRWGDSYVMDIMDNQNEVHALAVVLAIDAVLAAQQSSGAGAGSAN